MRRHGTLYAVVLLFASAASADGFDGQRLVPPMGAAGGFAVERPWILKHLGSGGGLVLHYAYDPVVERERPSGRILDEPLRHAFAFDFLFSFGLFNHLELAVHLPVEAVYSGDRTTIGAQPIAATAGVGDLRLAPKVLFWRGGNRGLHGSVGLHIPVSFPTGDAAALRGSGGFVLDPQMLFGIGGWRWELYLNLGYRWRSNDGLANLYGYGEITYGLGALVTLPI